MNDPTSSDLPTDGRGDAAAPRADGAASAPPLKPHDSLPTEALRRRCEPNSLGFATTDELEDTEEPFGQVRAAEAIRFAIAMSSPGYNVFALGTSDVGMRSTVREILGKHAAAQPVPDDWVYVENFSRPSEPRALSVPPGVGRRLATDMHKLVEDLRVAVPAGFTSREYVNRLEEVQRDSQAKHEALFAEIQKAGAERGLAVLPSPTGVVFAPLRDGEVVGPQEFDKLPDAQKKRLLEAAKELQDALSERLKELPRIHKELRDRVRKLDGDVTRYIVDAAVEELVKRYAELPAIVEYLEAVREDVVDHAADFRRDKDEDPGTMMGMRPERRFTRYAVNVLVDNSDTRGAPVVADDQATFEHLLGRIEHYAELGNLVTNFTLIKPGSLHRANKGFLLIDAHRILTEPYAWTALKRALQSASVDIETLAHRIGVSSAESLRPDRIPLDVKVVLFGAPEIYYLLSQYDPEFSELFKVEADFEDAVDRTPEAEVCLSRAIATLARQADVRPASAGAVARLIEEASRVAGDGRKLSTSVGRLFDFVQEAEHYAKRGDRSVIDAKDVESALHARRSQRGRIREKLLEAVSRSTILIDVSGRKIGQVNGLAAMALGDFTFGRPTRITATARVGDGRIIDIEREVELGGPLHSKGVLILTNYLAQRYAKRYPLSLSASLVFEQSYSGVEGDSASLAELCALLSALAGVPIKQSIAVTGSVNQSGQVQAIGAVNEKVEGFYEVCRVLGLDGEQAVIVPRANVEHLMLREDVADAAAQGALRIYPVDSVDDAMEILTGVPAGEPDQNGDSPAGTLSFLIEQQLLEFAIVAKSFGELVQTADHEPRQQRPEHRRKKGHRRPS